MRALLRVAGRIAGGAAALLVLAGCGTSPISPAPTGAPIATPTTQPATPTPSATPSPAAFTIATGLMPDTRPAAGWGNGRYLVTFSQIAGRAGHDVFGLRLASDGTPLDADPLLLSSVPPALDPTSAEYGGSAVAGDDAGFGVFFFGSGPGPGDVPGEVIAFTSVPGEGAPIAPATLVATTLGVSKPLTALQEPTAAASDGAGFVTVYQQLVPLLGQPEEALFGTFVAVDGGSVVPQGTVGLGGAGVAPILLAASHPGGVASNGGDTLAAWVEDTEERTDATTLVAARVTPTEATRFPLTPIDLGSGASTLVAGDGDGFLVVWQSTDRNGSETIRAIHYLPHGAADGGDLITPPGGFVVAGGGGAVLSGVAFAGGVYLVTWLEDRVLTGARVGTTSDTASPLTIESGGVTAAALASSGDRFLVVFERARGERVDLLGRFVDAGG